jgi:hypothetical protein|tara:strand:- start:408 stop:905 length:498 start_codon:yes stop_codon:yes gene_type:complete
MEGIGYWLFLAALYFIMSLMKKRQQKSARRILDQDESVPESDQQPGPFQSETLQDLFNEIKNFGQDILEPGADEIDDYEFEEPIDTEEQPEIIDESEPVQTSRAISEDFSEEYPEHIHKKYPVKKKVSATGHFISPLLKDSNTIKQAIILKEILDKPRALKRFIR